MPNSENNTYTKPINERERVDALRKSDNSYENSIHNLANEVNAFHKELVEITPDTDKINKLADKYATQTLEKIEAQKLAYFDSLTELPNKRSLEENLPHLLSFLKRENKQGSLLMLDIDHFKQTNDTYGHPVGNVVLKKVAEIIKNNIRESDLAFRYGGEEFTIFLMDIDNDGALKVAEKIREAIKGTTLLEIKTDDAENNAIKKTVSIGYLNTSILPDWQTTGSSEKEMKSILNELIDKADQALYASKDAGRNKVTPYNNDLPKK